MDRVLGIDFGTSTSLLGEGVRGRRVRLMSIGTSSHEMPSTIGCADGLLVAGEPAEDLPLAQSRRSVKRAITEGWSDIWLGHNRESPVSADAAIMRVLATINDRALALGVLFDEDAVRLSCPASWTGEQRERLLGLAQRAGLPVSDHTLIDEPVAAGIAWIVHTTEERGEPVNGKVLIFDMGGGTLDIAHLDVTAEPGRAPAISVLSSVGLAEAGDLLDEEIAQRFLDDYRAFTGLSDGPADPAIISAARHLSAQAKRTLSIEPAVMVTLAAPGWKAQMLGLSRPQLEEIFNPQWERARRKIFECLRASTLTYNENDGSMAARKLSEADLARDVDHVVLVGGMSRVPVIGQRIREVFPHAQVHDTYGVTPIEAVVAGLSETSVYENVSFHRPAYDFVLQFETATGVTEHTLYRAYDPLYNFHQAFTSTMPCFEKTARDGLPRVGAGKIIVRSTRGALVGINLESTTMDGIPVRFGDRGIRLRLRPNGEVLVVDGRGTPWEAYVSGWPAIRGSRDLEIIMSRKARPQVPDIELGHQHNNRYG
jgi:molecular chaperone DnaK (HSP70)